jgi:hypothetical protein
VVRLESCGASELVRIEAGEDSGRNRFPPVLVLQHDLPADSPVPGIEPVEAGAPGAALLELRGLQLTARPGNS